ncbi:MAG: tRNA (adenosine(37)-N6)-threonylcarbamoyltransferase complex ATPase subunit type 1 TsaE [Candidatus Pacebacteria bacterium]|nr:tRNA (adenosine(37)-N6)-threonylcarbamoyltransferase complex ATPase subunit type 1 TsaE [Candidatus Paceibacterota bacterium]
MKTEIESVNPEQTKKIAKNLAQEIISHPCFSKAFIVGLKGDLGGGKTTFVQGFASGLGIKDKITSPTFVLLKRFKIKSKKFKNFYHIDCYRMEGIKDFKELGLKEIISKPENIIAVEWVEKAEKLLPKGFLKIEFQFLGKKRRRLKFLCR